MQILLGLELGGMTLTDRDGRGPGSGSIGQVTWGPEQLLRDLELRLGLGASAEPEATRAARWADRMARLAAHGHFYSRSFEVDTLGTARAVLALRDLLVDAGWMGESIPNGGARLDSIHELEVSDEPPMSAGFEDRVRAVSRALEGARVRQYREIALAESIELWSAGWQAALRALERTGTQLTRHEALLPGAPNDTDLGRVQAVLRAGAAREPTDFAGDGSLVFFTAETAWETARGTAALLAGLPAEETIVIREGDSSALDNALSTQGLRSQGWHSRSAWRSALQVLPLALELAFEPKDPYRVLELLTLPVGPFQGFAGHRLARALARSPGIGSPAWEHAKQELSARDPADLSRVLAWLERRGAEISTNAAKADLLGVVERVKAWLLERIRGTPEDPTLLTAARQSGDLRAALEGDPRESFSLAEVRRLSEAVLASGTSVQLELERAGRIDHVSHAGALLAARENVVWWPFVEPQVARATLPWRRQELAALFKAGIRFPEPRARLAERARGWRGAVLAATRRLILVVPRRAAGASLSPHPLWDEIVALTGASELSRARIGLDARDLVTSRRKQSLLELPPVDEWPAASLPGGVAEWLVPREQMPAIDRFSATSVGAILGCPLQWALRYLAGVRTERHALPQLFNLNGTLGHRLVEELHGQGAFEMERAELEWRAGAELDRLFEREGAMLLRPGMGFERGQLRRQLVNAVLELARVLRATGLRVRAVEHPIKVSWRSAQLEGRIDLLLETTSGVQAVLDIKWGHASYRTLLESGQALQLAAYAFALAADRGIASLPEAAYFSLKRGRLLGLGSDLWPDEERLSGPPLDDTWKKAERTVAAAERVVGEGRLAVTGLRRSLPLLETWRVAEDSRQDHLVLDPKESCKYCDFDALCGRRWEESAA